MRLLLFYWAPVILYCLIIFIQSCFPSPESLHLFSFSDKVLHALGYALLGALFFRAYQRTGRLGESAALVFFLSVVSTGLYGISDEFHQALTPSRSADLFDVLADVIGGAAGAAAYMWLSAKYGRASTA
ncbi:MAG: hypothetical protein GY859_26470 [Desulfobacterales bacterium]|nr:hypothetical protein [Desulfobacterales bacterium]